MVDASVVAKWHLGDESHIVKAMEVLRDFQAGSTILVAPRYLAYEVINTIVKSAKRGRLPSAAVTATIRQVSSWGIALFDDSEYLDQAAEVSQLLGCSFYDALYIVTALREDAPLVSADAKLVRAAARFRNRLVWIEDYTSPAPA